MRKHSATVLDCSFRDVNGEKQTGFMVSQGTIRRGSRCSTSKAFLRPVRDRRNLHIAMKAQVTKILFDTKNPDAKPRAYGVRFKRNGKMLKVIARKEVRGEKGWHLTTLMYLKVYFR